MARDEATGATIGSASGPYDIGGLATPVESWRALISIWDRCWCRLSRADR